MANRLEPINLIDFTGGINLRRSQFALADSESPAMLNIDIDPRGGFFTRKGWQRWNDADLDVPAEDWAPRNAFIHVHADGSQHVYLTNNEKLWTADDTGVFTEFASPTFQCDPHLADFAAWADTLYIAGGVDQAARRRIGTATVTDLAATPFSEIDTPTTGVMPHCQYIEPHAGYMFIGYTKESGVEYPRRVRWSHPQVPDAFRSSDFVDLDRGGGHITGLVAFRDHILVFKTTGVWAIYGYDEDSFQVVLVSDRAGCPTTTAQARSETACYWYSTYDGGGIYAYNGNEPVLLSERLTPMLQSVFSHDEVYVSWSGRRLWVTVPWDVEAGSLAEPSTVFVFDDTIGESGAWAQYAIVGACPTVVLDGPNTSARYPLALMWGTAMQGFATLDFAEVAYDSVTIDYIFLVTDLDDELVTDLDDDIITGSSVLSTPFDAYYRTRWLHAGWPDRKKSFRRPSFICRETSAPVDLLVEAFRNYDESNVHRSRVLHLVPAGGAFWSPLGFDEPSMVGFDWTPGGADDETGTGADWAPARAGSSIERGGSFGLCRALQLEIRTADSTPGVRWGIDGIVIKYVARRFR